MARPSLRTPRLELVPLTTADLTPFHQLLVDPDVRRYLCDDRIVPREFAAAILDRSTRDFDACSYGLWQIEPGSSSPSAPVAGMAGFCGLRNGDLTPEPELLYGLIAAWWGRGHATEASRAVIAYAFESLGLPALAAATDPPNTASIRVLERLGFAFTDRREHNGLDTLFYRLERK